VTLIGLALLAAALGEAVARLPADACSALVQGRVPHPPAVQLLVAGLRSVAVLATATVTAATVAAFAVPGWPWTAAATVMAAGMAPLAAAPITAAPLLGAPLRLGLLAWCADRVLQGFGGSSAGILALLAGSGAAAAVWEALGPRRLAEVVRQTVRDTA
jgi:hypothetical protein